MEIELKLLIDPKHADAFAGHAALLRYAVGGPRRQLMTATYFDTPELHFRRADAGLRVRRVDDRWIQTMKAGGHAAGGLHQRNEWEMEIDGASPEPKALSQQVPQGSPWSALLDNPQVTDRLVPIFMTEIERTLWDLTLPDGTRVECVLDQGMLKRDDKVEPVSEVELELVCGSPESLIAFALELQDALPLCIGHRSKAERGYALFATSPKRVMKAGNLELLPDMSIPAALVAVLRHCMDQIQANEREVVEGRSPENLHQMRVGFRRLRSAVKVFRKIAPPPEGWFEESRWVAGLLGAARDFDVLADTTLPMVAGKAPDAQDWQAMTSAAQERAILHYEAAAQALRSPRYTAFVLRFHAWMLALARQALETGPEESGVRRRADKILRRADRRLLQHAENLAHGDAEAGHRLRIAAKQLRYLLELFGSLYPTRKTAKLLRALVALQESAGRLNDGAVASALMAEMEAKDGRVAFGAAFVRGYLAARAETGWQELAKRQKKIQRLERPFKT